jgi:predicted Co/Zn/Cd cation transporter (cation efflux family)
MSLRSTCLYIGAFIAYAALLTFWLGYGCNSRALMWGSVMIEPFALAIMLIAYVTDPIQ